MQGSMSFRKTWKGRALVGAPLVALVLGWGVAFAQQVRSPPVLRTPRPNASAAPTAPPPAPPPAGTTPPPAPPGGTNPPKAGGNNVPAGTNAGKPAANPEDPMANVKQRAKDR